MATLFLKDEKPRRVGARTDLPLVPMGRLQGQWLGESLRERGLIPDVIFTSALLRTIQTADEVQKILKSTAHREILSDFNEIDYGPDENQEEEFVEKRIGKAALLQWESHQMVPPGWQVSPAQLSKSWLDFSQKILTDWSGKTVLLVTHNGIARFAKALGAWEGDSQQKATLPASPSLPSLSSLKLATGAYGLLSYDATLTSSRWKLIDWNIRPHEITNSKSTQ
jgi:probable phosphoglycerate mutase